MTGDLAASVAARSHPVRLAPTDLVGLGLVGVRTRRVRAVLSALGISVGIATMIIVTGIPASSQRALLSQISALGPNLLQAWTTDEEPPVAIPEEAPAMVRRIEPVRLVSAVANTHTGIRRSDLTAESDAAGLSVLATDLSLLRTVNAQLRVGVFLDARTERFPMVVLGSVAAARLGITTVRTTDGPPQLLLGDTWFSVVGILQSTPLSPDLDRALLVGWEAARSWLRFDGHPTMIYLQTHDAAVEQVRDVLPATINPADPSTVQVSRPSEALAAKRVTQSAFSALFLGLAAVALLVGGIGVANTMVISVLERRREIGLRRALGASRGQIRGQFLMESVVLSTLGAVLGTVIGIVVTVGYARLAGWPVVIPLDATAGGFAGALLTGVLAGLYPAIRASRLTPTEALA